MCRFAGSELLSKNGSNFVPKHLPGSLLGLRRFGATETKTQRKKAGGGDDGNNRPFSTVQCCRCFSVCVCAYSVMKPRVPDMGRPKEEFLEVEEEGRVCVCV